MAHLSLWGTELLQTLLVILSRNLHLQKKLWKLKLWALLPKTTCKLLCHSATTLHHSKIWYWSFPEACLPSSYSQKLGRKMKDELKRVVPQRGKVQAFLIFQCSISVRDSPCCQSYLPAVGGWQAEISVLATHHLTECAYIYSIM